jgi:hypothetical protein
MSNIVTITRTLAVAVILAGAAIGCTSSTEDGATTDPAASPTDSTEADDLSGTYTVTFDDGLVRTWTANPCGHGCADVEQTPNPFDVKAQARLSGRQWTIEFSSPTGVVCDDDSLHPGTQTWTWDAGTSRGSYRVEQDVDACGDPAGDVFDEHSFSLTKS